MESLGTSVPAGGAFSPGAPSAVAWAAIMAGATAAAATTVVLVALGAGIGLTTISPWWNAGVSAKAFGVQAIVGMIVVQWVSAGFGGYLTGRLRTRWIGVHTHEVFFRDTAHGFLAWAVATVVTALVFSSAVTSVIGAGSRVAGAAADGAAQGAMQAALPQAGRENPLGYFGDTMFRSETPSANVGSQDTRGEAGRIVLKGMADGDVSPADRTYLAQLVAARTGLSQPEAQKRVDDTLALIKAAEVKAKEMADAARKAAAAVAIFTALSLAIGAFIASVAAGLGGRLRDEA